MASVSFGRVILMVGTSSTSAPSSVSRCAETARLFRTPRDDDAPAKNGRCSKPVQFPAQFHHVADDRQHRWRQFFFNGQTGDGCQCPGNSLLPPVVPQRTMATGVSATSRAR